MNEKEKQELREAKLNILRGEKTDYENRSMKMPNTDRQPPAHPQPKKPAKK